MTIRVLVLSISDRASKGVYTDKAGPAIAEVLNAQFDDVELVQKLVSDEPSEIEFELKRYSSGDTACDYILTSGGTGIGPRDNTPEVTERLSDRMIPGIAEYLRSESLKETTNAVFSRALAALRGKTLIINFPGSEKGARFCAEKLIPIFRHGVKMVAGKGH